MITSGVDLLPTLEGKSTFPPLFFFLSVPYSLAAKRLLPPLPTGCKAVCLVAR